MMDGFTSFVRRVELQRLPVRAVEVYVDGKLIWRHRWAPDTPFELFSHTKSFVALGVGFAVAEGKLRLDDSLASFFPEHVHDGNEAAMREIRLAHLLTMTSGFGRALLMREDRVAGVGSQGYLAYLFAQSPSLRPGESFVYSNGDSHLAAAMAERAMGQPLEVLLSERLFVPMGIPVPAWERSPEGAVFGASGLVMRLADMVKPGLCCLSSGRWAGDELIPRGWIESMVARRVETGIAKADAWDRGYGYQCWMHDEYPGAYRFDGAGGQISLMLPGAQALVGLHCDAEDIRPIRAAVDEDLLVPLSA